MNTRDHDPRESNVPKSRKKLRTHSLFPSILDSDLSNQIGQIKVREESLKNNVFLNQHSCRGNSINNHEILFSNLDGFRASNSRKTSSQTSQTSSSVIVANSNSPIHNSFSHMSTSSHAMGSLDNSVNNSYNQYMAATKYPNHSTRLLGWQCFGEHSGEDSSSCSNNSKNYACTYYTDAMETLDGDEMQRSDKIFQSDDMDVESVEVNASNNVKINQFHTFLDEIPPRSNATIPSVASVADESSKLAATITAKAATKSVLKSSDVKINNSSDDSSIGLKLKSIRSVHLSTNNPCIGHTLVNPDVGEVLFCVAAVIQAQIFEDDFLDADRKALYPEFNIIPELPAELGGQVDTIPERILTQESTNDDALRQQLVKLVVPTIDSVVKFLALIRSRCHYSVECNIIALVYLNRMTTISKLPLSMKNWRALWVTCVMIAQKFWEDHPMKTSAFNIILPSISKTQLKQWEKLGLDLLEYSIRVKPSLYAKYYFELRQLFVEIIGPRTKWSAKPMRSGTESKFLIRNKFIYSKDDSYEGCNVDVRALKAIKK